MNEQHLQDKFLVPFIVNTLGYQEVKANTVTSSLTIEEDLEAFISQTSLNKTAYHDLLKKYHNDRKQLLADVIALLQERIASGRNMATASFTAIPCLNKTSFRLCKNCLTAWCTKIKKYSLFVPIYAFLSTAFT